MLSLTDSSARIVDESEGGDRRGFLTKFGAALLGATAAQLVRARAADAHPPAQCWGLNSCAHHGGHCPGIGGQCCWTVCYNGSVYRCCDHFLSSIGWCTCAYRIMNC